MYSYWINYPQQLVSVSSDTQQEESPFVSDFEHPLRIVTSQVGRHLAKESRVKLN